MLKVLFLLVIIVAVSGGSTCTFESADENEVIPKENCIQSAGEEITIDKNVTLAIGNLQIIPFLATFLKFIGATRLTISVKRTNDKGQGYVPETFVGNSGATKKTENNRTIQEKKPQFQTSLPLIKLGNEDNYYYFETSLRSNFFEAFEFCRKNHMNLLSIESKKENDLIKHHLFNKYPKVDSIWTSGTDLGREGHYIWLSTGQPFTYTNWHPFNVVEPNNYNNAEHCIHIYQYFNTPEYLYWNDLGCETHYHFVCETEPIPQCS